MYKFYRKIDENTLMGIQKYEGLQLAKFKAELDSLCIGVSKSHGWNYAAHVDRWIDMSCKWNRLPLDDILQLYKSTSRTALVIWLKSTKMFAPFLKI